ncbi:hypothetical protein H257_18460 [Aphanomyces astaci]|uniref:Uncharacterized protein n=1 Tax=Aphanomyces astaci TaxID=112090 RepID=W4FB43_APHAT|nr:hypothetical protein H257_18460 [Aphanomyces astaci]ETV64682.1 hypothetical protein H257_18460 [Aphanomyces astaci]|eukprot:XP_009845817.1 hypothetical protein H257_18460 [Aphanomyces astaci]
MPTETHPASDIDRAIAYVKKARSRYVSKNEILDIIMANAVLRQDGTPAASRTAARLRRRKEQLVQQVWKEFIQRGTTTTKPQASRDMSHRTRLPVTSDLAKIIQEFVRHRRQDRQRTVAKDVVTFCGLKTAWILIRNRNPPRKPRKPRTPLDTKGACETGLQKGKEKEGPRPPHVR